MPTIFVWEQNNKGLNLKFIDKIQWSAKPDKKIDRFVLLIVWRASE